MDKRLRPGDIVAVRPPAEILATLDEEASLDALPFMPEMVRYVGRRFRVSRRVEKICDTAGGTVLSRRMRSTVFLEDLRCDGSGHDGCQAGCRLYWKEDWLRRVVDEPEQVESDSNALSELEKMSAAAAVSASRAASKLEVYRCQATEAPAASEPLGRYDIRQYAREVAAQNVRFSRVLRVLTRELVLHISKVLRLRGHLPLTPTPESRAIAPQHLLPGDVVRVRSRDEIAATLDSRSKHRGLYFDWEMIPYCGGTYRVKDRVERFIDDRTGTMIKLSSDCLILEGVCCSGERSSWRWFCPRGIYPFWREAWLERVEGLPPTARSE